MSEKKQAVGLVTGAGRGIGRATARRLAGHGAYVYLASRSESELGQVAEEIRSVGGACEVAVCDVSDEDAVNALFSKIQKERGGVDFLVNNAGAIHQAAFSDLAVADWDRIMAVNVRGVFLCAQLAFRQMTRAKRGAIVNIASLGGIHGIEKFPGFSAYTTSKYAVVGLTEAMAVEAKGVGIRVACVAPGAVETQMLKKAAPSLKTETRPEDVADLICYLLTAPSGVPLNGTVVELHSNV